MFIDGVRTPAASGAALVRKKPLSGEVETRAAAALLVDALRAFDAAARAFPA